MNIGRNKMNINPNPQSSASQCALIKEYLEAGNKLTSLEALKLFGCMRLPSRIHDLNKRGMNIKKEMIVVSTGKRVAQYSL